jgi:hypothetical protein
MVKFAEEKGINTNYINGFRSTHPKFSDRIDVMESMVCEDNK